MFANWTGSIPAGTPSLTFVMQNNLVLQANFIPNPFVPVAGSYNGLFSETNEVLHPSSGNFTISVTGSGSFSGQMQNGPSRYSLKGQFDVNGHAHVIIPRKNMNPLTVELQLDLTPGRTISRGRSAIRRGLPIWRAIARCSMAKRASRPSRASTR